MQSSEKDNLIFIRLFPRENVLENINLACRKYQVKTAVILSGLGQLAQFELGFFKKKGNYAKQIFKTPHELLSLTGNISKQDNNFEMHLHATLGNARKQVVGGHFIAGIVSITAEIVLLKTDLAIRRILEPQTGLMGLFLE